MIVVNLPEFLGDMQRKAMALDMTVEKTVAKTALDVKRDTMKNTPVRKTDTARQPSPGNLRRGWESAKTGKWEWEVKNEVEYGHYVEFGTSKMAGRFMLTKAVHIHEPIMQASLLVAIQKGLMA